MHINFLSSFWFDFLQTTDRHETDLNLTDENGIADMESQFSPETVSKEILTVQSTQTDSPLLFDCKTEPEISSELMSKETNAIQTAQTNFPLLFGGNGIAKTEFESTQADTSLLFDRYETDKVEPPFSSVSMSKEIHTNSYADVNGVTGSTSNNFMVIFVYPVF